MILTEGNWVAFRFIGEGTFTNEFVSPQGSLPPTGQPFGFKANVIGRVNEDGQWAEEWLAFDNLSLLTQLGVSPTPEAGS